MYVSPVVKRVIEKMLLSQYKYRMLTKRQCTIIDFFRLTTTSPYGDRRLWAMPNYGAMRPAIMPGETSALIAPSLRVQEGPLASYSVIVYFANKDGSKDFVDKQIRRAKDDMQQQGDQAPFDVAKEIVKSAARRVVTPKGRCEIL